MTVQSQLTQTLATLKSAHSTLLTYSIQTQEEEARNAYQESAEITHAIVQELKERLQKLTYEEPQYKSK